MVRSAHFASEGSDRARLAPDDRARLAPDDRARLAPGDGARLAPLLGALSLATDLGAGNPAESALRTAVIAERLGERLGLAGDALADVYYTALLRYLGCSGFAHEE